MITAPIDFDALAAASLDEMTNEHQAIADLIDRARTTVDDGDEARAVLSALDRLREIMAVHFEHQNQLLRASRYPDRELHKTEHDRLLRQIDSRRTLLRADDDCPGYFLIVIDHLFSTHIVEHDRRFFAYLKDRRHRNWRTAAVAAVPLAATAAGPHRRPRAVAGMPQL